jgi:hypothetical protein
VRNLITEKHDSSTDGVQIKDIMSRTVHEYIIFSPYVVGNLSGEKKKEKGKS